MHRIIGHVLFLTLTCTSLCPTLAQNTPAPTQTLPAQGQTKPVPEKQSVYKGQAREMRMVTGQLTQDPLRVFVETHITESMQPELILLRDVLSFNGHSARRLPPAKAAFVITNYKWTIPGEKNERVLVGTLLVFTMDENLVPWYRTGMTVTPILRWTPRPGAAPQRATTFKEIYLGNALGAHLWTFLTLSLGFIGIWLVSSNPLELLRATNGRLSLSQTQMAAWTAAIGGIVYSFGLTKLSVPEIPASLVALMGLSAGTTALGILGPNGDSHSENEKPPANRIPADIKHLLTNPLKDGSDGPILLERAQMSVWTVLMLILFLYKSLNEGIIWEVPWEMVALTGISQASYIVPKQFPRRENVQEQDKGNLTAGTAGTTTPSSSTMPPANPPVADQ